MPATMKDEGVLGCYTPRVRWIFGSKELCLAAVVSLVNHTISTFEAFHQTAENNTHSQRLMKHGQNCLQRHRPSPGILRSQKARRYIVHRDTHRRRSPEQGLGLDFHLLAIFLTPDGI